MNFNESLFFARRTSHLVSRCFIISLVKADEAILSVGKSCTGWPLGSATKDNDPMESWHSCKACFTWDLLAMAHCFLFL